MEFISIGPYCITASFLKNTNNRDNSYPFDWIFSSLSMVEHCIDDEFKTYLNTKYIKTINNTKSSHKIYDKLLNNLKNNEIPVVFNHVNLLNKNIHEKYKKRCLKFINALKNKNVCLVYTIKNNEVNINYNINELINFSNLFTNFKNVKILVLYITTEINYTNKIDYSINNLYIYKIQNDDLDTINEIFNKMKNIKKYDNMYNLLNIMK